MKFNTKEDAVHYFVSTLNAIPQPLLRAAISEDEYPIEVTKPCENNDNCDFFDAWPIWGTMWSFDDPWDEHWLEEEHGLYAMSECGFRIYLFEPYGYFFGIDGAGYDFYEAHWTPLYDAMGFNWSREPEPEKVSK